MFETRFMTIGKKLKCVYMEMNNVINKSVGHLVLITSQNTLFNGIQRMLVKCITFITKFGLVFVEN